jgi:DNA-directed RNA polymerase subunit M/transcription elongation factor TFIIS
LEIEECIYIYSKGKLPIYKDKFSQVAFNLANNPSHLLPIAATDAMQLVCMNDSKYAHGTQIEQERSNFHEKVKLARESLKNAQEFVFVQEKSTKALIRCANCGSDDIYSDSKQTAGADEPATNFCTCNKCGKRWKMR